MKISVITPCLNAVNYIDRAIKSVLQQGKDVEHIIVDGGSTDGTLDILKKYPHLKWKSEPDGGQVDAMNKGFLRSCGDIIVYLNADDYFEAGAFEHVRDTFAPDVDMVMGKVRVLQESNGNIYEWINDPRCDFMSILRHWEPDAFCVNPVGYFYRRKVQEMVPFEEKYGAKMDLAFLLHVAEAGFVIKRTQHILGTFSYTQNTQTARQQSLPSYWCEENFPCINQSMQRLNPQEQYIFSLERQWGYQERRRQTAQSHIDNEQAGELIEKGEILLLPETEEDLVNKKIYFAESPHWITAHDSLFIVLSHGKVASKAICTSLSQIKGKVFGPIYHLHHFLNLPPNIFSNGKVFHIVSAAGLAASFHSTKLPIRWKFIVGVRDPLACALSGYFEIASSKMIEKFDWGKFFGILYFILEYFDINNQLPLNCYNYKFDKSSGYQIIIESNIELLLYSFENLNNIFPKAFYEFTGIDNFQLQKVNVGEEKSYSKKYKELKNSLKFDEDILDKVYTSKYVKHFYNDESIAEFRSRWQYGIIYDVGFNTGQDTEFYLKKGFRVVAIDADPFLIEEGKKKFFSYIKSGRLILLNIGLCSVSDSQKNISLPFYINCKNSGWSSFSEELAGRDGSPIKKIEIPCGTLADIVNAYGEAYYIKIDIEGYDQIVLESLVHLKRFPKYLSVENGHIHLLRLLENYGYTQFKYVNQAKVPEVILPQPSCEGKTCTHHFAFGSSGPFGEDIADPWLDSRQIRTEIGKVWDLETGMKTPHHRDEKDGWFDLHACRPE